MTNAHVPKDIQELSRERSIGFRKLLNRAKPDRIQIGQIWSTHSFFELAADICFSTDEPYLVAILEDQDQEIGRSSQVSAAPISLNTGMASEFDLRISADHSPVGFDFMIEVWNETPVLAVQLKTCLGRLSETPMGALKELYRAQLLDTEVPSQLREWVGLRIMGENDHRLAFQAAEVKAVAYLSQAAIAAVELEEGVVAQAEKAIEPPVRRPIFQLAPIFAKLSELLRAPAVAFAAGTIGEEKSYVVHHQRDDEEITLELVNSPRSPYRVYLIVHHVSSHIGEREGIVTISMDEGNLHSAPTKLMLGAEIVVGHDPNFDPASVRKVSLELL